MFLQLKHRLRPVLILFLYLFLHGQAGKWRKFCLNDEGYLGLAPPISSQEFAELEIC